MSQNKHDISNKECNRNKRVPHICGDEHYLVCDACTCPPPKEAEEKHVHNKVCLGDMGCTKGTAYREAEENNGGIACDWGDCGSKGHVCWEPSVKHKEAQKRLLRDDEILSRSLESSETIESTGIRIIETIPSMKEKHWDESGYCLLCDGHMSDHWQKCPNPSPHTEGWDGAMEAWAKEKELDPYATSMLIEYTRSLFAKEKEEAVSMKEIEMRHECIKHQERERQDLIAGVRGVIGEKEEPREGTTYGDTDYANPAVVYGKNEMHDRITDYLDKQTEI